MKIILALVLALLVLPVMGLNTKMDNSKWLLDILSCPVGLEANLRNDSLFFTNRSGSQISEIHLGVVSVEDGKYKVIEEKSTVKIRIEKTEVLIHQHESLVDDAEDSIKKNGKLVIIFVLFSDGSFWKVG